MHSFTIMYTRHSLTCLLYAFIMEWAVHVKPELNVKHVTEVGCRKGP